MTVITNEHQTRQATLNVRGMHCGGCATRVKSAASGVPGVAACDINLQKGLATITYDSAQTSADAVAQAVSKAGYPAAAAHDPAQQGRNP